MKNPLLKAKILEIIKAHSESGPVYSTEIESMLSINGPALRDTIRELRREGYPIANSHAGYYYADSFEQIKGTVDDLEGRAWSMIKTAVALKKTFNIQPTLFDTLEQKPGL